MERQYQITFYVPEKYCEIVKKAMFDEGAGTLGNYQECAWQTLGQGQFKPMEGSTPYIGNKDKLEKVEEYKVDIFCEKDKLEAAVEALKNSHPYEMPAFSVIELIPF